MAELINTEIPQLGDAASENITDRRYGCFGKAS